MERKQQVALVTGASSGMGKEIAKRLLRDGLVVYAAARRVEQMRDLEDLGAKVLGMDITQEASVAQAVEAIRKGHGGVDVLVNNAGFGLYGAVEDTSLDDARYQFEVNLFGLARLTQLLLPYMRERRAGKIINISSMGGKIYTPLGAWYHATKHALEGWSDCLRLELAPFGIEVAIVEPGIILTEFGDVMTPALLRRSGQSAYGPMAQVLAKAAKASYEKGAGSPPSLIADTVSGIVRARRPRTRYAVGSMAKPLIFLRKWLSDRLFDRLVMSQVKG